jgi:hypothetical protein
VLDDVEFSVDVIKYADNSIYTRCNRIRIDHLSCGWQYSSVLAVMIVNDTWPVWFSFFSATGGELEQCEVANRSCHLTIAGVCDYIFCYVSTTPL